MALGDLLDDGQAQPAAFHLRAQRPVEGLEHPLALGRLDARAGVLHLQHHHLGEGVGQHTHRHAAAARRVLQGVVDQVAHHLTHQHRLGQQHTPGRGRGVPGRRHGAGARRCAGGRHGRRSGLAARVLGARLERSRALVAQVDAALQGPRHEVQHHGAGDAGQVHRHAAHGLAAVFGTRQGQQLVHHVRGALAGQGDVAQRLHHRVRVGAPALDLARHQLGLHAQPRQRRLQLMRGVGQEVALRGHGLLQALQQVVDGRHQRRHFLGHAAVRDRAEVGAVAAADALLQFGQRQDAARQRQPHQQHGQRQDDELRQDHALDDLGGQARALVQGLRHLHQRGAARTVAGTRRSRLARGQLHMQIGHAHRLAGDLVVAVMQLAGSLHRVHRHRQVGRAGQEFAAPAQHLEEQYVGVVGAHQAGGHTLEFAPHGLRRAPGRRHLHRRLARHGQGDVGQFAVVGTVGDGLGHEPGDGHAHGPQQQQRRQHPVQDLAEQRDVLALPFAQHRRRLVLAGRAAAAGRQGPGLRQRSSPGSSPARARWRCAPAPARSSCAGGGCRPRWRCCSPPRPTRTAAPPAGPC